MVAETGATTERVLNRMAYAIANKTTSLAGGLASDDRILVYDTSADGAAKYVVPGDLVGGATGFIAAGSTLAVTAALHTGRTIKLDTLTGSVATLPAATGSGNTYNFLVTVLATSNSHIVKVANASDTMIGIINGTRVDSGNAVLGFAAQATSDTITLNRTTTGSVTLGEWFSVTDEATNVWAVNGMLSATGAAFATPFSATV